MDVSQLSSEALAQRIADLEGATRSRRIELAELENELAALRAEERRRMLRPAAPRA